MIDQNQLTSYASNKTQQADFFEISLKRRAKYLTLG